MNIDKQKPSLAAWLVESIRLSAFYAEGSIIETLKIWEMIAGEAPEEERKQPRAKSIQEEGNWGNGKLITVSTDSRVDILYHPIFQTEPEVFPQIGPYAEASAVFKKAIDTLLLIQHSPKRLAFGMILSQSATDRPSGYRKLSEYLPGVKIDPDGSRDFLYQINRPRETSISGITLMVNRVSMWAVAYLANVSVSMDSNASSVTQPNSALAVRVSLDINTPSEFAGVFDAGQASAFINKLVEYAVEIGERGDIA